MAMDLTYPITYACLTCERTSEDPLEVKPCQLCEKLFCTGCLPDHEAVCARELEMGRAVRGEGKA
jgi:hypothetical protein